MALIDQYPGLRRAALEIAYDNGMVNRTTTEEKWLTSLDPIVGATGVDHADLQAMSEFIDTLTEEELNELCCGGQGEPEQEAVLNRAPDREKLDGMLNDIFEGG